jgi:putative ABC transport system substrate-binding protein
MNNRRKLIVALGAGALTTSLTSQKPARASRIGVMPSIDRSGGTPNVEAFKQGLRDLGYVEGRNIVIEYRWNEPGRRGNPDIYAAEYVRLNVDVIVVGSGRAALAAKKARPFPSSW